MKRDEFFRIMAGTIAGGAFLWNGPFAGTARAAQWPAMDARDESFWKFLRGEFPLSTDRAYLNTGGLGASPYAVIDAVKAKMDELEAISEPGHDEQLMLGIKGDAARLLGCDADELAFTRNTTEGINIVANGLPLRRGDEVITTTQEHVGNALTWMGLMRRSGIVMKFFEPSTASDQENIDRIQKLITPKTRLISVPHAVTTTGLILPVRDIASMARARNIWCFVDGAQTAGMFPFRLHDIGCDAYATSGHKWLMGPKETGILYVRKSMLDTIEAKWIGAYSNDGKEFDFEKGLFQLHPSAQRYEYGTISVPLRVGLGAAVKFIQRIGAEHVWKRDQALSTRLYQGLKEIPNVTVLSPATDSMRSAMITLSHAKLSLSALQGQLNSRKLRTRPVTEGGMQALRISTHIYNSMEEVENVLDAVRTAKI